MDTEEIKKLPIKFDEESFLVAGVDEISKSELLKDISEVVDFLAFQDN